MSEPQIPDRTQQEALVDLLESIALEETALAHILNAEGEKIQAVAGQLAEQLISPEEAIEQQDAISKTLRMPIKKQMLLQFKLEDVLDALEVITPEPEPPVEVQTNTGTVTALVDGISVSDSADAFYNTEVNES